MWGQIKQQLNEHPEPIKNIRAIYAVDLSGNNGGQFGLKIADGKADTIIGHPGEANCTLSMSVKDFQKLLEGNLNTTTAYMMGKVKVKGSLGLALQLEKLLKQYRF